MCFENELSNFLLYVKGIEKSFTIKKGIQKKVLNSVNFNLNKKEILTIMGPSGGGKSTFLKILAGIVSYDAGHIYFKGNDIQQFKKYYTSQIGFIFQDYKLIPHLNVFENVALALRLRGVEDWEKKADEALAFCLISHLSKSYIWNLSGGEAQRVGIARAIAINPAVIFADEATGNLDARTAKEVMLVFKDIKEQLGTSFVLVTHDPKTALYSDRQYFLNHGILTIEDPYAGE